MKIYEWWIKIFKNNIIERHKTIEKVIKILEANKK